MNKYVFLDIDDFAVAWEVYCGRLISVEESSVDGRIPMSSWMTSRVKKDRNWLHNEMIMENIRRTYYPSQISRLRGMYFFEDKETAIRASLEWNDGRFKPDRLAEVEFLSGSTITKVDHNWIFDNMNNVINPSNQSDMEWIHKYWQGKTVGREPLWELLVMGKAMILGTELRTKAYETIAQRQPKALGLLEISRIAWDLGYNFGHVATWLVKDPAEPFFEIQYGHDENDANNDEFIKKFHQYQGVKNTRDLNVNSELASLDLRSEFFQFLPSEEELALFSSILQD